MKLHSVTMKSFFYGLPIAFIFLVSSCKSVKGTTFSTKQQETVKQEADKTIKQPIENNKQGKRRQVKKRNRVYTGSATYYADRFQGKQTASGELYDRNKYTAAIRFGALPLPFGTTVEVVNVKRNKKVIVKVNDRMGEHATAIIDLSHKAAEAIGLDIDGRTAVEVRVVREAEK